MSIVINALYKGHSFLMSDSRMSDNSCSEFQILDEDTQKIFLLKHNMAIGFTGHYSLLKTLLDDYDANFTHVEFADELAAVMREDALQAMAASDLPIQFALTGKCRDGTTGGFCIIAAHQYTLKSLIPKSMQHICYVILNDHAAELTDYFRSKLLQQVGTATQERRDKAILECMEQTIYRAAELDRTVNTKTQLIELSC